MIRNFGFRLVITGGLAYRLVFIFCLLFLFSCAGVKEKRENFPESTKIHALHLLNHNTDEDLELLCEYIPELYELGINMLIIEVNYGFFFTSHPELRQGDSQISIEAAKKLSKCCKNYGIRLVPEFQFLGHQSWAKQTFPLLTVYPELDLTPGAFPDNEGLYCREWDLTNPRVNEIVFALIDEIIDAFEADAFHVGMDEVFLLGTEHSPSTKGMDPAVLYARAVNDIYNHIVRKRGLEMMMWGDRLIDGKKYPQYGAWEADTLGTASAIDNIPKDIIICDWHYEQMASYPSVPMFLEKGFRILPSSWKDEHAAKMLIKYSYEYDNPNMLGHMFTTWGGKIDDRIDFPPMLDGLNLLRKLER